MDKNAELWYYKSGDIMYIWDGNKNDTTNFKVENFLKINSCGFQNTVKGGTIVRENGRYDYHFLLIESGECEALHNGKTYILTSGNLLIYAPEEEQRYTFNTDCTSLWCHFGGYAVNELFSTFDIKSGVYMLKPDKRIFESFSNLIQRFHQPEREKYSNVSLLELIYEISDAGKYENQENLEAILPVLTYININYNQDITLDELAKKSGYSKSRFSHIFSSLTGTSPMKYQNSIRLKASAEMLLSTKNPISEIALGCGFSDPLYYSKLFKKEYGISPTEYRKKD